METILIKASYDDKSVIRKLLELYIYDFSEFDKSDVNKHGEYGYERLDCYWIEEGRYPFLIKTDGNISGFAFIRICEENKITINSIAEYFILKKYRKMNIGKNIATQIFDQFKGKWNVSVLESNIPAFSFWEKTIKEFTDGNYKIIKKDDWEGPIFEFESKGSNV